VPIPVVTLTRGWYDDVSVVALGDCGECQDSVEFTGTCPDAARCDHKHHASAVMMDDGSTVEEAITDGSGAVADHLADPTDAHDASAVSNVPAGGIAATTVQAAINELDTEKSGTAHTHTHASTTGQTANQHHNEDHAARHANGGADEVAVEGLATAETDTSLALKPDGVGGVAFAAVSVGADVVRDAGHWEVMMADGFTPPEPMTTEDETDWLYAWVPG
jgi:hypothetical protein